LADPARSETDLSNQSKANSEEMIQRALRAAGKFSSGAKDVSSDHDLYVAEAIQGSLPAQLRSEVSG
jgi:hypothetical protein